MMTPSLFTRRSFTMIETLVAMSLLAVGLLGLMAASVTSGHLRATTRQNEQIEARARDYLDGLRRFTTAQAVRDQITSDSTWVDLGQLTAAKNSHGIVTEAGVNVTASNVSIMTEAAARAAFGDGQDFDFDRDGVNNEGVGSDFNAYNTVVPVALTLTWDEHQTGNNPRSRSMTITTIVYPRGSVVQ